MFRFLRKKQMETDYAIYLLTIAFLISIIVSRVTVWLIDMSYLPQTLYLVVADIHIHHYIYGLFLVSIVGVYAVTQTYNLAIKQALAILFGMGLGLIVDEFALWVAWHENYWGLLSKIAIVVVGGILFFMSVLSSSNLKQKISNKNRKN